MCSTHNHFAVQPNGEQVFVASHTSTKALRFANRTNTATAATTSASPPQTLEPLQQITIESQERIKAAAFQTTAATNQHQAVPCLYLLVAQQHQYLALDLHAHSACNARIRSIHCIDAHRAEQPSAPAATATTTAAANIDANTHLILERLHAMEQRFAQFYSDIHSRLSRIEERVGEIR
jgi:hypothetical protein